MMVGHPTTRDIFFHNAQRAANINLGLAERRDNNNIFEVEKQSDLPENVIARLKRDRRFLIKVVIPDDADEIESEAFKNCKGLTSVEIPEGITVIGSHAFERSGLNSVTIPEGVTEIGEHAFSDCKSLRSVRIPDTVERIGKNAFAGCENLRIVQIPEMITHIERATFAGCTKLREITIPEGVTHIEYYAFYNCKRLSSVILPEGLIEIGVDAFGECKMLHSIIIPPTVREISHYAFRNNISLKRVTLSENTQVQATAFPDDTIITRI